MGPRTGKPIHHAIVWQDRRTAAICARAAAKGRGAVVTAQTGLVLDPYFSGTKIALDARQRARRARSGRARRARLRHDRQLAALAADRRHGARHRRDQRLAHAAVRHPPRRHWDDELLPAVRRPARDAAGGAATASAEFGATDADLLGAAMPIAGIAGDQQAALSARPASRRAWPSAPTAPAASSLLNTGDEPCASQQPAADDGRLRSTASRRTRWKAASSSPAPRCSGCATGCG